MSCYHPLKAWQIGFHPSGKPMYKITSYDVHHVVHRFGQWIDFYEPTLTNDGDNAVYNFLEIPCGKCIGCRLKYSRDWALRCMNELEYHDKACFITLTYNDEHLPVPNKIIDNDGCITDSPVHPLCKRDIQLFIKRLRKKFKNSKVRYFACGEYGSRSMRPHAHIILFGVDFSEDRIFFKKSYDNKFNYYTSPTLDDLWHGYENGSDLGQLGFAMVCDVSFDTCAYVARYVTKKKYGKEADFYESLAIPPEFSLMSRRPGIGRMYFEDNYEKIYKYDEIIISDTNGGHKFKPPKYYDKLYDMVVDDLTSGALSDKRREIAENHQKLKSNLTSLSYLDSLISEEANLLGKLKHAGVDRKKV